MRSCREHRTSYAASGTAIGVAGDSGDSSLGATSEATEQVRSWGEA